MDNWTIAILAAPVVLYVLIMIPLQYRNIAETKARRKQHQMSHNEEYEKMSFEQQELQFGLQGDLLTIPATLIASLIYKLRNWNEK